MAKFIKLKLRNVDFIIIFINLLPWVWVILSLYNLQIVKANYFNANIEKLGSGRFHEIHPKRGAIYAKDKDNNLYPIAVSFKSYNLYFNPKASKNIDNDIKSLANIFPELFASSSLSITKSDSAILIKKDIDEALVGIVSNLKLDSVFTEEFYTRLYPEKNFLSTIIGFTTKNDKGLQGGQYGLEKYYNDILKGESGYQLNIGKIQSPISGKDIVLNIDYFVQKEAEKYLMESVRDFNSAGGMLVVSDLNGNIAALAEEPSFDLNKFNEINNYNIFRTKFTQSYEPGSVMKTLTFLSAIENNVYDDFKTYNDTGYDIINGKRIENFDHKARGIITFGEAFEQSLNIGAEKLERLIGHSNYLFTLKKFKFDEPPVIDLPYLTTGNLSQLYPPNARDINFATASYGHGITLSPAHLLSAINSIASDGKRTNIRLLRGAKVIGFGNILEQRSTLKLKELMERVIKNGSGKSAKTAGFKIGGKTGSAYVPMENTKGYSDDVLNTFIVIFPLTNPKFTILARIDRPEQGIAGVTTVPMVKKMIEFLINYYNLQPDNPEELIKDK